MRPRRRRTGGRRWRRAAPRAARGPLPPRAGRRRAWGTRPGTTSPTAARPASLVLTTTGTPVRRSNARRTPATRGSSRSSTVWMRAVPSTCTTAGMRSTHSGRTRWTNSMYGLGWTPSKISGARSREHHRRHRAELLASLDGVHPPQVLGAPGVAQQAAVAERPGPVLAAPLEPADDRARVEGGRHLLGEVAGALVGLLGGLQRRLSISSSSHPRPRAGVVNGADRSPRSTARASADPSAVPESPAAGWTHTCS